MYNDGVTKLFLYVDEDIEKLHTIVEKVKHNRKVGEQYMTWQEMLDYEKEEARQEAREEGLAEGRLENIAATIKVCKNLVLQMNKLF